MFRNSCGSFSGSEASDDGAKQEGFFVENTCWSTTVFPTMVVLKYVFNMLGHLDLKRAAGCATNDDGGDDESEHGTLSASTLRFHFSPNRKRSKSPERLCFLTEALILFLYPDSWKLGGLCGLMWIANPSITA